MRQYLEPELSLRGAGVREGSLLALVVQKRVWPEKEGEGLLWAEFVEAKSLSRPLYVRRALAQQQPPPLLLRDYACTTTTVLTKSPRLSQVPGGERPRC